MDIMILLGSKSDLPVVSSGLKILESLEISYELRIASAHRSPDFVHQLVADFDRQEGQVLLCVAGKSAHLAGVVASQTVKPVIGVPVYNPETSGMDALLSISQMPKGVPVACMGFGSHGFQNSCWLALQIMALSSKNLMAQLKAKRLEHTEQVKEDDKNHQKLYNCQARKSL